MRVSNRALYHRHTEAGNNSEEAMLSIIPRSGKAPQNRHAGTGDRSKARKRSGVHPREAAEPRKIATPGRATAAKRGSEAGFIPAKRRGFGGRAPISKEATMRLDKYLKVSRIIKRRTVANEACDAGRVTVNGRQAKASLEVKAGDIIEIKFGDKITRLEVLAVKETVRKEEAAQMYAEV